jgi:1,4-dihydroxy-2-naphthoate octaprenyltransferase
LVDGSLDPRVGLAAALLCAALGLSLAALSAQQGRSVVAILGFSIAILAWSYSGPPLRLAARGWGELDTALIVAILVPLVGYATFSARIGERAILSMLPSAAAMLVMMLCVEYPDVEVDARVGKRNLVVRVGRGRARLMVYVATLAVYGATALAVALGAAPTLALFAALTIPLAWGLVERLARGMFGEAASDGALAARGVAFFVAVLAGSALAYAVL